MRNRGWLCLGIIALTAALGLLRLPRCATLKKVTAFDLPGPGGKRFDYLTIDTDDHYLFSTHLAAGQTYVIDLRTNKVVATVADTPGPKASVRPRTEEVLYLECWR
jgi:YVTN family beta-propeller protein